MNPPSLPPAAPAGPFPERPGMVTAIAVMTLVNGIINLLWAFALTVSVVLGTLGIGILCVPLTLLPGVLGIFELIYAAGLIQVPPRRQQPSQLLAILEICMILSGNVISLIVGILALVFYGDPAVRAYFAAIGPVRTPPPA
jgi:hypothetical protein